ncbi:MAG: hypothetical protein NW226_23395 [Microscillaceae bacterium]|nr:hypothetical protein [Microscillaceae bacterium]
MKKSFENCTWSELNKLFGLQKLKTLSSLDSWVDENTEIVPEMQKALNKLQMNLADNFMDWNEDELKMQFIAPLLYLVDYTDNEKYHPFSQRPLQMQKDDIELLGIVDWLLASGQQFPETPYFFLHEYKKEKGAQADPLGQLLAAMLTAQYTNQNTQTLYGAYVVGKDWYFMILENTNYAVSRPYQANESQDIKTIFNTLQKIKDFLP